MRFLERGLLHQELSNFCSHLLEVETKSELYSTKFETNCYCLYFIFFYLDEFRSLLKCKVSHFKIFALFCDNANIILIYMNLPQVRKQISLSYRASKQLSWMFLL